MDITRNITHADFGQSLGRARRVTANADVPAPPGSAAELDSLVADLLEIEAMENLTYNASDVDPDDVLEPDAVGHERQARRKQQTRNGAAKSCGCHGGRKTFNAAAGANGLYGLATPDPNDVLLPVTPATEGR